MLGTRQTGLLQFKVADLMRDAELLPAVRDAAQTLLARWPQHVSPLLERWLRHGREYGRYDNHPSPQRPRVTASLYSGRSLQQVRL